MWVKKKKTYFACHSPRYPKFTCPQKNAYIDYKSRSCMFGKNLGSVNRDKAIEYCKQNEANLASIHNQREYDIYYSLVKNQNLTETQKSAEYWFGLRHQNDVKAVHEGGLGTSASAGFDKRYMDVAYFVDGTNYTGFHRFHKDEPTHNSKQENFNGQTFTADGWYRNWDGASKVNGALCRSAIDTSAVQHSTINEKRPFC